MTDNSQSIDLLRDNIKQVAESLEKLIDLERQAREAQYKAMTRFLAAIAAGIPVAVETVIRVAEMFLTKGGP